MNEHAIAGSVRGSEVSSLQGDADECRHVVDAGAESCPTRIRGELGGANCPPSRRQTA